MRQKQFYQPPEVNVFTIRIDTVICASVDRSFTAADFDDINEVDFDPNWL